VRELAVHGAHDVAPLGNVTGVALNAAGERIYVADGMNRNIVAVNYRSGESSVLGRQGSGPGEFQAPGALGVTESDSLLVFDASLWRVTVYDPSLVLRRTYALSQVSQFGQRHQLQFLPDGGALYIGYDAYQAAVEERAASRRRALVRGTNSIELLGRDEDRWSRIAEIEGLEVYVDLDQGDLQDVPFAKQPLVAAGLGGIWHFDTGSGLLQRMAFDGTVACQQLWPARPQAVSAAMREQFHAAADVRAGGLRRVSSGRNADGGGRNDARNVRHTGCRRSSRFLVANSRFITLT
jgi:hypothetical protein